MYGIKITSNRKETLYSISPDFAYTLILFKAHKYQTFDFWFVFALIDFSKT